MTLTAEQLVEAQKKAMDKIYEDIAACETVQALAELLIRYYKSGYDDGQKVIVEQYRRLVTSHSEKLNAPIDSVERKAE